MRKKIVWLTTISMVFVGLATGSAVAELVAYYPLNEGSGNIAADVTGNGHDATAQNGSPTWVNGQVGYGSALQWDGVNAPTGWMNCGTWNPSEKTGELTVALWVYWGGDAAEDGWQGLIGKRQGWMDDGSTMMWCIEIDRDSNNCQFFRGGSYPGGGVVLPVDEWTHVAASFDGTTAIFYINGEPTSGGGAFSLGPMTDATIAFGCVGGEGWNCFNGILDEVRIYDHGLSQGEIQIAMLPGAGPKSATSPVPNNGTSNVPQDVVLSWTEGQFADTHDVYFGTSFDNVSAADKSNPLGVLGSPGQRATTYDPDGLLEFNQTYFWRVDEVNAPPDLSIHAGEVWSFRVEPFAYPITNVSATASSENISDMGADKTVDGSGLNGDLHSTQPTDMWLSSMFGEQPTWIQFQFDKPYELYEMYIWNQNQAIESSIGFGLKDVTLEHSVDGVNWTTLGDVEIAGAPGRPNHPPDSTLDLRGVHAQYVRLTVHSNWKGIVPQFGLSEVRFYYVPIDASDPSPASGDSGAPLDVTLDWRGGRQAVTHEVYFSKDEAAVIDGTALVGTVSESRFQPGTLEYGQTYYWKVNEVNDAAAVPVREGEVWEFSTVENLIVDDFEGYTDDDPAGQAIWQTWIDGFGVPANGSQVGYLVPSYAERSIVNSGRQSMPFFYNNVQGATYSEAERTFVQTRDWTTGGVTKMSLWFRGYAGSTGSFVEGPAGTFTMTGSGTDIWDNADEFHFAYRTLTGPGTIVARVQSLDDTDPWAKAGVMIRETLEPGSAHALACVTPQNGVASQGRIDTGGSSFNTAQGGITAPHWVRLERSISGVFTVSHSSNGSTWIPVSGASPTNIQMGSNVYIGLAVTSHNAGATCQAVFSNVATTGNVSGQWASQDIGIATNAAEQMYIGLTDAAGRTGIVEHEDPAATQFDDWTLWPVDLAAFADQGVNIGAVKKIILGAGSRTGTVGGGSGMLYFDDIAVGNPVIPGAVVAPDPAAYDFETGAQGWGNLKRGTAVTVVNDGGNNALRATIDEAAHAQTQGGMQSGRDFTVDDVDISRGGYTTMSFRYRADDPDFNGGNFVFHWIMSTEAWSGGGWYGNGLWGVVIADGQWHQQALDLSILGEAAGGWQGVWGDQTAWAFRDDLRYNFELMFEPADSTTTGSHVYIDDVMFE